jgi:acetylornithine deacetylase/succinyl-diaminopimelate desuccinylase-like protein
MTALFGARYAVENGIPLNINFIWELEEEIGSPHFEEFMKTQASALKSDSVLVSDTVWISRDKPAVPYGLRGMFTGQMLLETGTIDAHSGETGGAARNPIGLLLPRDMCSAHSRSMCSFVCTRSRGWITGRFNTIY